MDGTRKTAAEDASQVNGDKENPPEDPEEVRLDVDKNLKVVLEEKTAGWWIKTFFSINLLLIIGLGFTLLWFFSALYPIIAQPRITQIGKEPTLGGPRLGQQDQVVQVLGKHSIEGFDVLEGVVGGGCR
jgi:hypothetical protein